MFAVYALKTFVGEHERRSQPVLWYSQRLVTFSYKVEVDLRRVSVGARRMNLHASLCARGYRVTVIENPFRQGTARACAGTFQGGVFRSGM